MFCRSVTIVTRTLNIIPKRRGIVVHRPIIVSHSIFWRTFTATMDEMRERQNQAEETLATLKQQLSILRELAVERQKVVEQEEIKQLELQNINLEKDILRIKKDLTFCEAQNGVKHVPLPVKSEAVKTTLTVDPVEKEQLPEQQKPKEKKVREKKKGKPQPAASTDAAKPVDVSRLHMKVGKIVNVKKHPDADTLFVEEVDVGEDRNRTIVSGLVAHYTLAQMQDRIAIFMCNLKPVKMRGILSEGMIMCASQQPEACEIITVPEDAVVGDEVVCLKYPGEPDTQLNPKKKIWEQVQPELHVDEHGNPGYKGDVFTIPGKGDCKVITMRKCGIK